MRACKLLGLTVAIVCVQISVGHAANENINGQWAARVSLPLVASSGAVLPNGKVLLWAADDNKSWGNGTGAAYSVLLDLQTGTQQSRTTNLSHNLFCTGTTQLADGRVLINGGGRLGADDSAAATTIYDPVSNAFSRVQDMVIPRGYHSNTILSDGSVFTLGGSWSGSSSQNRIGEIWTASAGWRSIPGIPTTGMMAPDSEDSILSDVHYWLIPTGNGKVLYAGPSSNMKWLNTNGSGSVLEAGPRGDDTYAVNGTAVMYDAGKILKAGGSTSYEGGTDGSSSAYTIDTTQGTSVSKLAPMAYRRTYVNGVALPDGKVMIVGGVSYAEQGTDGNSVLNPEIWNPATGLFSTMAAQSVPRNYHSIALLLPDARVMAAGGGLCGSCSTNHLDYQIYSPPYLFDAVGNPANRPAITSAPSELSFGNTVSVATDRPVAAFSLVRMATATHTVDNDQRRLSISFSVAGTNLYNLNVPSNSGLFLPGYWMLFALDSNGVPSVAKIVHVQPNTIARLVSPPAIIGAVGQAIAAQPEVVTLQDFLSFGGTGLPPGVTVNPVTGQITGTPTASGRFDGSLTATDGQRTVSTYLTVIVSGASTHPPSIAPPGPQASDLGATVSLAISASDQDGDPLTFAASNLPPGLSINASGVISGTVTTAGSYNPVVTVTDSIGLSATAAFPWTVSSLSLLSANSGEGHGTGPFTTASFTPASNSLLVVLVGACYSGTSNNPANITMSGGGLNWTRQLAVSRANGNESGLQVWAAEVGTAAPMTLTLDEGSDSVYVYFAQVRNYASYNASSKFGGSVTSMTLSEPTGALTLSAAPAASSEIIAARFHNAAGFGVTSATPGAGWRELGDQYPFVGVCGLEGQMRGGSTSRQVAWTDVNDAHLGAEELIGLAIEVKAGTTSGNRPPAIVTPQTQISSLGATVSLAISASDPDGDVLTYGATGLPNGLNISPATGVISGTPSAAGSFSPTVTVTDAARLSASASFSWTVNGSVVNHSPTIVAPAAQASSLGAAVSLAISAADPDGDTLTYEAPGLPTGLAIDSGSGIITGTATAAGSFSPTVKVTDTGGLYATASFAWTVNNPNNRPPGIVAPASLVASVGADVSLAISASDPDNDVLTYEATGLPGGLTINPATGVISGTINQAGAFTATVKVTDPGGLFAKTAFACNVADIVPSVNALPVTPNLVGATTTYAPTISTYTGVTFSWNFGDDTAITGFAASPQISHAFSAAGVYSVTLTMKNSSGNEYTYRFIQAIYVQPSASGGGASSSGMVLDGTARLWVANPDNDSVAVINLATNNRIAEIPVGTQPVAIARHKTGTIWVLNRASATISVIDPATLTISKTIALPRASRPGGLVFSGTSGNAFVPLEGKGQLAMVTAAGNVSTKSNAVASSRFLATNGAKTRLYLTSFITPPLPGESTAVVATVDASGQPVGGKVFDLDTGGALQRTFILRHSDRSDTQVGGRGIPNYLGAPALSPDGASLWVPSKQDNIKRGKLRDNLDLDFQNTVRAIISRVDLSTGLEDVTSRIDLDNSGLASAAVFHPTGAFLFVALQTSREIAVLDPVGKRELFRFPVGRAPSSLVLSGDGNTLYAGNFMDRSVSVVSLSALLTSGKKTTSVVATVSTIGAEKLVPNVLLGKQLFYDAADPRLAREGYLSCAVCHADGEGDGRVWDFTGFGEGLRNTISLLGHGGMAQGFLHWTANFDEVQDFEGQIRELAGGSGLMNDADFAANSAPLGGTKAGLSADLDALAAYVSSLTAVLPSPFRNADGSMTAKATSGKTVFANKSCGSCHAGTSMTISGDATGLRDIGTIDAASGKRLGKTLTGFDVPSLRGVWATGPYLHKGVPTLDDAILAHGSVSLTSTQRNNLVEYLKQVEQAP